MGTHATGFPGKKTSLSKGKRIRTGEGGPPNTRAQAKTKISSTKKKEDIEKERLGGPEKSG